MTLEATIRVIDDDEAVRRSLTRLLKVSGYQAVAFEGAEDFLSGDDPTAPGCLILDMRMPGMDGLALQQYLIEHDIRIPVILLTAHADVPMAVAAMHRGAIDFLEKPFDKQQLLNRVRQALELDATQRERERLCQPIRVALKTLSPREREVLERLIAGAAVKEIAAEFGTSRHTVKHQRARILRKMQADSEVELVRMIELVQQDARQP